jgi:hypothetical protein
LTLVIDNAVITPQMRSLLNQIADRVIDVTAQVLEEMQRTGDSSGERSHEIDELFATEESRLFVVGRNY